MDADTAVAAMRSGSAEGVSIAGVERRLLAVFGDRLALERQLWRGARDGGSFETEMLALIEADEEGRVAGVVDFDADDAQAAWREAHQRWSALEPAVAPVLRTSDAYFEALRRQDLGALRAVVTDDFVLHDRRRTGLGLIEGADAFLRSAPSGWDLVRDLDFQVLARPAITPFGSVAIARNFGRLRDGGAFERLLCSLSLVSDGRFERIEFFEIEDAARALARFEELR
jgi:ketosteroid isomerase-like protein